MGALDCSTASAPPSYSNQPQAAASKGGLFIPTPHTQASCTEQEIPSLTPLQNRAQFRKLFLPDHVRFDLPSCERRLTSDKELLCVGVMK
jgi:hypothetical protein